VTVEIVDQSHLIGSLHFATVAVCRLRIRLGLCLTTKGEHCFDYNSLLIVLFRINLDEGGLQQMKSPACHLRLRCVALWDSCCDLDIVVKRDWLRKRELSLQ